MVQAVWYPPNQASHFKLESANNTTYGNAEQASIAIWGSWRWNMWVGVILFLIVIAIFFVVILINDNSIAGNNAEVDKRVADKIKKRYPKLSDEEALERAKKARKSVNQEVHEMEVNGYPMPNVICPHCHKSGEVRMKEVTRITKNRVNSVAGKAIGLGTNSESKVKEMNCKNCNMTWDVA